MQMKAIDASFISFSRPKFEIMNGVGAMGDHSSKYNISLNNSVSLSPFAAKRLEICKFSISHKM
jgi:hypothetical protein